MTVSTLTGREYRMTPEGQADLMRSMKPFIDEANKVQKRMQAICAPVIEMQSRMRESLAPMIEARQRVIESTARTTSISTTFTYSESLLSPEIFMRHEPLVHIGTRRNEEEYMIERIANRVLEGVRPAQKMQTSYPLPAGSAWEKLQIKFVDGHTIKVKYPSMKTVSYNYKDLGCQNDKSNNPDTKWDFLRTLASNGGSLPDAKFNRRFNRQAKYELSKRLKTFFNMSEAPFYEHKKGNGYTIKLVLHSDTEPMDEEEFSEVSFDA